MPKLTKEVQSDVCDGIKAGAVLLDAVRAAGLSKRTYYRWLELGKDRQNTKYHEFRKAVLAAKRQARTVLVQCIIGASADDWRAAAFMLERRYPKLFGKKTATELSGPGGGPVTTTSKIVILPAYGADDDKPLDD